MIPFFSFPERTATWTSQRNWGSGTSYVERNVPSGQGAWQGMAKLGVMPWMVRRRSWMLNTLSQYRRVGRNHNMAKMGDRRVGTNHKLAVMGSRRVGMNHNVAEMGGRRVGTNDNMAEMGDRRVGMNNNVAVMGDRRFGMNNNVAIMGGRRVGTNRNVAIMGDRRVGTNHNVAEMDDRRVGLNRNVAIMGDRRVGTNHNVAIMGDRRVGMNNVTLTGDVVTISQNNEVKTEGTACSVSDETAHQNHDEVRVLQEFKKPKSFSAADLKSKTEHKEHCDDNADSCFLQSLVPDMKKLSDRKKLKFKELIISSISHLLDENHA